MFDRLKRAMAAASSPEPPRMPGTALVPVPLVRAEPERPQVSMGYLQRHDQGSGMPYLAPLRLADQDVRAGWAPVAGNVRGLIQNNGHLSGAVDQFVAYAVGSGLSPQIEPEADLLGWEPSFAKTFARRVERLFDDWARDPLSCDDRGQQTLGQLQAAALRSWFATGDVISHHTYRARPGAGYKTGLTVIDPVRVATPPLYNPSFPNAAPGVFHYGIEHDAHGAPLAYWLRPVPGGDPRGVRIPVFGPNGRQAIVHSYIGEAGQVRGISPFASVVEAIRQTVALGDAMVLAAHAAAAVIGTITSDLPSDAVARSMVGTEGDPLAMIMNSRVAWHEGLAEKKANVTLGPNGKVFHLSSGERFDMHAAKDHYGQFPEHLKALLREISRAAGLPYEMMSLDRNGATYSSGRLGLVDFWSLVELRRSALVEPMSNVALANFVEEGIDSGLIRYPGGVTAFRKQKTLALKCRWFGPAKPSADELKSVRAAVERLRIGLSSLADETAANGGDWETTLRQKAEETRLVNELGLELPWAQPKTGKTT